MNHESTSKPQAIVLLPTYNEIDNLPNIVPAILKAANVDILILDDASPDGTGALADKLSKQYSHVQVIHRKKKEGLGAAYIEGFQYAIQHGYDFIIEMDADFSHPPESLKTMLALAKKYDLVLGSRWIAGGGTKHWPWYRQFISKFGSFYSRNWLGLSMRDVTGGFKCFNRRVLEKINLSNIQTAGYAFQIEINYRVVKQGFSVIETPIVFIERQQGVSKMNKSIVLEAFLRVPLLRFKKHDT